MTPDMWVDEYLVEKNKDKKNEPINGNQPKKEPFIPIDYEKAKKQGVYEDDYLNAIDYLIEHTEGETKDYVYDVIQYVKNLTSACKEYEKKIETYEVD